MAVAVEGVDMAQRPVSVSGEEDGDAAARRAETTRATRATRATMGVELAEDSQRPAGGGLAWRVSWTEGSGGEKRLVYRLASRWEVENGFRRRRESACAGRQIEDGAGTATGLEKRQVELGWVESS